MIKVRVFRRLTQFYFAEIEVPKVDDLDDQSDIIYGKADTLDEGDWTSTGFDDDIENFWEYVSEETKKEVSEDDLE